ncbi:sterol desaturase family protein [Chryseobacterium caseinilyticum]|uniref:Sterol desaturase family protein n=1 Tax=Chryseobacterium caseinilyticum TaxID=2771428 RepID=A0ABR8ZCM6_9FLAO|nr:sterol desaturase family protein [Chryseobacterium caseinilyticum]MBD8082645.1 sterol desaturase family protein [Chryseobacterium caseinilyticum]
METITYSKPVTIDEITALSRDHPNLLIFAVPVMIILTVLEYKISQNHHDGNYDRKESVSSFFVGLGSVGINLIFKSIFFLPIIFIYNSVPWRLSFNWWTLIPCYIIYDLASYFSHLVSHKCRFWWATHVVHHSSDTYNFSVSFRLSWMQSLKLIFFFPVMLFGFHPLIFLLTNQIATLFQFWVHTEYIKKLPAFIEFIFATPSNHRVHHGSQPEYIDKNFGATFIIWDRIFGTYASETIKPKYGIGYKLKKKYNIFYINFHEYSEMFHDVRNAEGIRRKIYFLFGNPSKIYKEKLLAKRIKNNKYNTK